MYSFHILSWHLYGLQIRVLYVPPKYPWYAALQMNENKQYFFHSFLFVGLIIQLLEQGLWTKVL